MRVLILGHKGMLGHMVHKYLSTKDECELINTELRWPSEHFKNFVLDFNGDFVVNCIGAIHQKTDEFKINTELPIWLDKLDKSFKIIHPGTDCELDSDSYGSSKREAAEYIIENGKDTTIIQTSIIGPELDSKDSLLEWFLNSEGKVFGYTEAYWNGNTTLQWSKVCYKIMKDYYRYDTLNIPTSECNSKYKLLNLIKEVFKKDIVVDGNPDLLVNKCLHKSYDMPFLDIKSQLQELKEFYYDN